MKNLLLLIISVSLSWTWATDDRTPQAALVYQVYQSEKKGALGAVIVPWTANLTQVAVNELVCRKKYWFTVKVRDEAGNVATYKVKQYTPPC